MAQLPLPVGPAGSVPVSQAASLLEDGDGGAVFINGWLSFSWGAADAVGRRTAAVQLVRARAASQVQVATAFKVNTSTVYRWDRVFTKDGIVGLLPEAMGPKGPSRLTGDIVADITARRAAGGTIDQISAATGVSVGSVCKALATGVEREITGGDVDVARDTVATDADDASARPLPVLPVPADRRMERAASRFGVIDYAKPAFAPAARAPLVGLMLAIPALVATGLIGAAYKIYGARQGFYSLASMIVEQVLRGLVGEPRAEGATRINPTDLGRILGLDRAPEVQTVRRVMRQMADTGKAADLQQLLAKQYLAVEADIAEVLYVDGHVRTYHGKRKIQKTHVSRLRFPAPATVETWINDAAGQPVWVVMAEPGASLASELRRLLPEVRALVGDGRRVLVGFDRGGFSPALFKEMIDAGFDVLTWRKGPAPDIEPGLFTEYAHTDQAGAAHLVRLADTTIELPIDEEKPDKGTVTLRQVTKLDADDGHQTHALTSRTDLPPAEIVWRMAARWRQENYFRFGRMNLALDAHDTYQAADDDGERLVPNPAKRTAFKQVQTGRGRLAWAEHAADAQFLALRSPLPGQESVITNDVHNQINEPVINAETELAAATEIYRAIPARLPLSQVRPGQKVLDTETKLITHAIRMAAFNTQTVLARTIKTDTGYARATDEAHNLIRQALKMSGDIDPDGDTLHIRLDPLPTARATRAVAELCQVLNQAETLFPDTTMKLHYTVKTDTLRSID